MSKKEVVAVPGLGIPKGEIRMHVHMVSGLSASCGCLRSLNAALLSRRGGSRYSSRAIVKSPAAGIAGLRTTSVFAFAS